ncbi:MAG: DNA-3-methyladenine glycosylase I [Bacilli bacterium]
MKKRCDWVKLTNPLYVTYHDHEWGVKEFSDDRHFEYLILETFQAGLSWETVLNKREAYRKAMWNFHPQKLAKASNRDLDRWLNNPQLIRHKGKFVAAIENAKIFLSIQMDAGSFHTWIMQFFPKGPITHYPKTLQEIPTTSVEAIAIANSLKQRGMKFVGPKIIYAHLQAMGLYDDHQIDCAFKPKA